MNRPVLILSDPGRCADCAVRVDGVCAELDARQLADMERSVSVKRLSAGQILMLEGDRCEHAVNVTSGQLKVYKSLPDGRTQLLRVLRPGNFLGSVFRDASAFTVSAVTDCELCIVPRPALKRLFEQHRDIEDAVMVQLEDELAQAQNRILALGRMTAMERVSAYILEELAHAQRCGDPADRLTLPLGRAEIGDLLGLTIETVSRCMTRLRKSDAIALEGGKSERVRVLDAAKLGKLAGAHEH
ncbi:Crp/Fnr family transcriptional regulator [Glycocaulis profundi]|nr:Crp/Fnr family transcriptional regulator [Glycocaulis profundi]